MYSGTTLTPWSGRVLGAHQKFDRVARKHLGLIITDNSLFPSSRHILHFEGKKGPDAIKRKSPAKDEPWHYYSPFNETDSQLIDLISGHYNQLVKELRKNNHERIAFEAAWLAHAIVDGLTPAHHYPYEQKLAEIRGEGNETRNSIKKKIVVNGTNRRDKLQKNWKVWGPKGLFTVHGLFEMGVATLIAPLSINQAIPQNKDIQRVGFIGVNELFRQTAREIAVLDMYDQFYKRGWTIKLLRQVRYKLAPSIVKVITLTWLSAMIDAGVVSPESILKENYENQNHKRTS